jgi:hypothetical protein
VHATTTLTVLTLRCLCRRDGRTDGPANQYFCL